ncbi:MAG: hypothetical protein ACRD26_01855 [Vicinamibacterales bacterium]
MSLRIACDLDGTLADMESALEVEAERLFGPGIDLRGSLRGRPEGPAGVESPDPTATTPGMQPPVPPASAGVRLSDRQQRQLWAHVRGIENFWASLKEIEPGAVARLASAAAANDWELLFITTRPSAAGETTQIQSQRWLKAHGFDLPSVYVVSGSRGRIAAALTLDAVLDDRLENCFDVATDSHALSFLVWRDAPQAVPPGVSRLGIHVVGSIAEALERLETPHGARRHGLIGRLRGRLGI